MRIAIVTGASSGMGKEFVIQLDANEQFDEIWAIALEGDLLEQLQGELRTKIRPIAMDLSLPENLAKFGTILDEVKPEVTVLVNASGFGIFKSFEETPLEKLYAMVDVNTRAMMAITHMALPYMKTGANIYNIASGASFQPTPYMLVYGATKAACLSFSRALNMELQKRGIRSLALCPFWVKTNFFKTAASDDTISYFPRWVESKDVVRKAFKDMKCGKDMSIYGLDYKLQMLAVKLLPCRLVMRIWCMQQKH